MKTKLLLSVLFTLTFTLLSLTFFLAEGQVPQGFNYQAIARDDLGNPIADELLPVTITIQSQIDGGTVFWVEEHSSATTNAYGLFKLIIGDGARQSGTAAEFNDIDWQVLPKFIKTQIFYDSELKDMGTSELWSVPYSMVAGNINDTLNKLYVKGETTDMEEALFQVKNKDGQIIFAVYNEGVRVYVSDGDSKGKKGGFAIGGFGAGKADAPGQEYFVVSRDSIRAYIYDDPLVKRAKGGFAIGGFGAGKGFTNDYLLISPDSSRIYIDNAPSLKGKKGGFAIGGFGAGKGIDGQEFLTVSGDSIRMYIDDAAKTAKGGFAIGGFGAGKGKEADNYLIVNIDSTRVYVNEAAAGTKGGFAIEERSDIAGELNSFTYLEPDNYFIGHRSGKANQTGLYNSFLGYETASLNDAGSYNTILGYQSGYKNSADHNVFLGYKSGYNNTDGESNTFLGHVAGFTNSTGVSNVFLGDSAGYFNDEGKQNIFLGNGSGKANDGDYNAFIGYQAGYKNLSGTHNSFIGYQAGYSNETGTHNAFIGYQAGWQTFKGSKNIFIGYQAGLNNYGLVSAAGQPGNNNIYIGESAGASNYTGNSNVYIGLEAGKGNLPDWSLPPRYNVYIGYQAGFREHKGAWNTFIGYQAGYNNNEGHWSTFIGYQAGYNHLNGNYNTFIGYQSGVAHQTGGNNLIAGNFAGYKNVSGTGNVFLGYEAGYNTTASNRLQISNTRNDSLIYGEFDTKVVRINNKLGIGITPGAGTQALEVSGNGRFTSLAGNGNVALRVDNSGILTVASSDMRLKEDIISISDALSKVLKLRGVTFSWKDDPSHLRNIGFIAQEVEEVLPELVFTNESSSIKGINYAEITAVLAESVKEQQKIIESQEVMISKLKESDEANLARIEKLEHLVLEIEYIKKELDILKSNK